MFRILDVMAVVFGLALIAIMIAPFTQTFFAFGGNYHETEVVEYHVAGFDDAYIEVPSSTFPVARTGFSFAIYSFITPDDPSVRQLSDTVFSDYNGRALASAVNRWVNKAIEYRLDSGVLIEDRWQFPAETLRLGAGDCEDMALLIASILKYRGVDVILLYNSNHLFLAAAVEPQYMDYTMTYDGREWVTIDSTGKSTGFEANPLYVIDSSLCALNRIQLVISLICVYLMWWVISGCARNICRNLKNRRRSRTSARF